MTSRDTVYPTAAELAQAAAPCTWCQRPSTGTVVELDQDAHDHYQDVCDRNARLLTTFN